MDDVTPKFLGTDSWSAESPDRCELDKPRILQGFFLDSSQKYIGDRTMNSSRAPSNITDRFLCAYKAFFLKLF